MGIRKAARRPDGTRLGCSGYTDGGGEVLARALEQAERSPVEVAATKSWPPNLEIARRTSQSVWRIGIRGA